VCIFHLLHVRLILTPALQRIRSQWDLMCPCQHFLILLPDTSHRSPPTDPHLLPQPFRYLCHHHLPRRLEWYMAFLRPNILPVLAPRSSHLCRRAQFMHHSIRARRCASRLYHKKWMRWSRRVVTLVATRFSGIHGVREDERPFVYAPLPRHLEPTLSKATGGNKLYRPTASTTRVRG